MRLRRAALTVALAVVPVMTTPAHALTCPLLSDTTGDAYWPKLGDSYPRVPPLYSAYVDIVGVDVVSGPTTVTVVTRLASLDPDLLSNLLGAEWIVGWNINGNRYSTDARRPGFLGSTSSGVTSSFRDEGRSVVTPVPFAIDTVNDTVTWTVPRSLLPDLATPGATFTHIVGITNLFSSTTDVVDDIAVTYVDQSAGCIPAS